MMECVTTGPHGMCGCDECVHVNGSTCIDEKCGCCMESVKTCHQCGNTEDVNYLNGDRGSINLCADCFYAKEPETVCLCGSTRFGEEFKRVMLEETLKGNIVLTVGTHERIQAIHDDVKLKQKLDRLHMGKIRRANRVIVINPGGYIGESTAREIAMARRLGKPISYTENFKDTERVELSASTPIVEHDIAIDIRHDCLKEAVELYKRQDRYSSPRDILTAAHMFAKFVETGEA